MYRFSLKTLRGQEEEGLIVEVEEEVVATVIIKKRAAIHTLDLT